MLGALLFSNKPGVAPFWCGISQDVNGSKEIDETGSVGPTPFQVVGGVWSALQYILRVRMPPAPSPIKKKKEKKRKKKQSKAKQCNAPPSLLVASF
jgi:hypothetical protein